MSLGLTVLAAATALAHAFTSDLTAEPVVDGGQARSVAWNDLDADRRPDLVLGVTGGGGVWLYRNTPTGLRRVRPAEIDGLTADVEGVALVDLDNDGAPEILAARTDGPPLLFRNRGAWQFHRDDAAFAGVAGATSAICAADFDSDGFLDVAVITRGRADDLVYRNVAGRLTLQPEALAGRGGDGRACAVGDANSDGRPDLFIGDFLGEGDPPPKAADRLFLAQGGFRFVEAVESAAAHDPSRTYGASFVDWDEDGDDDLFVSNIALTDRNVLFEQRNGALVARRDLEPSRAATGPSKGHAWGDYDNDGDLDLYIAEGTEGLNATHKPFDVENALFEQESGRLVRVTQGVAVEDAMISAGVAHADVDLDGDLDLVVANWGGEGQPNSLYRNDLGGHSLSVALRGRRSNSQGVGARAILWVNRGGRRLARRASLWPQSGYGSMNAPNLHFGLGREDEPLGLDIIWPSGERRAYALSRPGRFEAAEDGGLEALD